VLVADAANVDQVRGGEERRGGLRVRVAAAQKLRGKFERICGDGDAPQTLEVLALREKYMMSIQEENPSKD